MAAPTSSTTFPIDQPIRRPAFFTVLGGIGWMCALAAALFVYVRWVEPNWIAVTRLRVQDARLGPALAGARIVQIADLHIDRFGFRERQLIRRVNGQRPDWILVTGDLINRREGWPVALEVLGQLRAAHGVWVVPGNTDNLVILEPEFSQGLQRIGAHLLRNAHAPMAETGAWLVGVDDPVDGHARLLDALRGLNAPDKMPILLMAHSSDIMADAKAARIPLVLVGHTHGGQLGIGWLRRFSEYANRGPYMAGRFQEGETTLYVNRGIGWKTAPYRLLASPEITVVELIPDPAAPSGAAPPSSPIEVQQTAPAREARWLSDFETDGEHAVRWRAVDAFAERSEDHVRHGRSSAKVTFRREESPKFMMDDYLASSRRRRDWSRYGTLCMDMYNPQPSRERLLLQLKDGRGRLYKEELFLSGESWQSLRVKLADLTAYLDLSRIVQLNLFRWNPSGDATFYIDAVRLEPGTDVAAASSTASAPQGVPAPSVKPATEWQLAWESSLVKLLKDAEQFHGRVAGPMQLALARGEYESVQLVLVGGSSAATVTAAVGPLVQEGGSAVVPPQFIDVRRVGYVKTKRPYYPVTSVGDWPDPLPAAGTIEIPAKKIQPLWITVGAPDTLPAGRYNGAITVSDERGRSQSMAFQVTVWNFTLPRTSRLKTAFDFYRARLEQAYRQFVPGGSNWADRMDELEQRYFFNLLKHRISPVWGADPTKSRFAWDVKDYLDRGLTVFGVGNRGGSQDDNWPTDPVELEKAMVWYRQALVELRFAKLLDHVYVYAYDEPALGSPHVAQVLAALHHEDPSLKTLLVLHDAPDPVRHAAWLADADIVCLHLTSADPQRVAQLKALGKEVWIYVSSPAHPFPSLVIDEPALAHRIIPWMAWKLGAGGLLYWCVNFWDRNPWEDPSTFAKDQNGNGFLYYPSADGPVSSIRLEVLRDGIEDYEYLAMLRALVDSANTRGAVDSATLEDAERLMAVDPALAESTRSYTKDPEQLFTQRQAIAEMIETLQTL